MRIDVCPLFLILAAALSSFAQSSVREDAARRHWILNAGESTYVVGVNDQGMLQSLYWGPKLEADARCLLRA